MRQTDCQMLMSAYLIITFQNVRGEFFHMGLRGWKTTKILMQYFDLLSDCATPRPSIKDVNLFRGEIIMILYKYFLFS